MLLESIFDIMSTPINQQETEARGSYISVAASITARIKCCIGGDTTTTSHDTFTVNTHSNNGVITPKEEEEGDDVEISLEPIEQKNSEDRGL